MNFRTMIQTGPVRANELFGKMAETSETSVKNRDKLFGELKSELEQHIQMEQDHLLPILRKHTETKDLAGEVVKDNRDLRAKLAELDGLPKTDTAFLGRVAELRKAFRQHARNDRKELLPVVQQALKADAAPPAVVPTPAEQPPAVPPTAGASKIEANLAAAAQAKQAEAAQATAAHERAARQAEDQKPVVTNKVEASLAAAVQAKQAEATKAMAAHERAEQKAEDQRPAVTDKIEMSLAAAAQAKQAEAAQQAVQAAKARAEADLKAEQDRHATLAASQEKIRQQLELAERQAAAERIRQAAQPPTVKAAAGNGVQNVTDAMAAGAARLGTNLRGAGEAYVDTVRRAIPDLQAVGVLPGLAANGMTELGSAWLGLLGQAVEANARMTQELAERQRKLAATTWQGWVEANAQAVRVSFRVAQQGIDLTTAASKRTTSAMAQAARMQPGMPHFGRS